MEYSKSEGRRAKSQKRRRRIRQFLANIECSEKLRVLASSRPRCLSPSQLRDRSACDLNCCICAKNATSSCRAVISRRAMFVDSSGSFLRTTSSPCNPYVVSEASTRDSILFHLVHSLRRPALAFDFRRPLCGQTSAPTSVSPVGGKILAGCMMGRDRATPRSGNCAP